MNNKINLHQKFIDKEITIKRLFNIVSDTNLQTCGCEV